MITFTCTGCLDNKTPQIVYAIGEECVIGTVNVKVENDEEQEQFILYYNITEQETYSHYFSFIFGYNMETVKNSEQFEYSDNLDSKIEFDENGYYVFDTSRIFYISYKNSSTEIKNIISSKECTLEFPIGTFAFPHYGD
jgi:hypothetical protein